MKKYIFFFISAVLVFSVHAQEEGSMWVGGSLGGQYVDGAGDLENKAFNIGPEFGYILSDKLGVGIELNFGYANTTNSYSSIQMVNDTYYYSATLTKAINRNITINPFIRYSYLKISMASFFADGGLFYSHSNARVTTFEYSGHSGGYGYDSAYGFDSGYEHYTYQDGSLYGYRSKNITNSYGVRFRPGVAFNLSEKFSLLGRFGVLGYTHSRNDGRSTNSYNLSFDMENISIGAIYSF